MDPTFLIILALAFGAMWLMTNRTRKQQKQAADFRANLTPGQDVMTGSGLFGTIVEVEDDVITLEISEGVTTRWLRPAIAKLIEAPVADDLDEEVEDDENVYDDESLEDVELEDDELEDDELEEDDDVEVPDDASSLTDGTDEGDSPRR
ncbi:preprotein translocase subunit YajC [Cellulomonas sp. KRMCY2]|uniref:preprotein translocase subunit YajC n=1 Tax=Cellulomonas sp. KRMCY2 TaxID=1304865 RepID=UPI00045E987F|nr:preprotein translocase subunit YajC [Cellulomonas sp. KRMCY2]